MDDENNANAGAAMAAGSTTQTDAREGRPGEPENDAPKAENDEADTIAEGGRGDQHDHIDDAHDDAHAHYDDAYEHEEGEEYDAQNDKKQSIENVHNPYKMTYDELVMHLYVWEWKIKAVSEYYESRVIEKLRTGEVDDYVEEEDDEEEEEHEEEKEESDISNGWTSKLMSRLKKAPEKTIDDGSKTRVILKKGKKHYLNLTDDAAHVVEFYAPWCPHCQNYKWDYADLAAEVTRRSTSTPVQFHALSCDVYRDICATYDVSGYPTVLAWKEGEPKTIVGVCVNEEDEPTAESLAEELGLDLANEELETWEYEFNNTEDRLAHEAEMKELARHAAKEKKSWHEQRHNTHNDRYHNAALSLAFAVKSQLFQTLTEDGKMDPKRRRALDDFLNLLDWATPQSWRLRTGLIMDLQWEIESDAVRDRRDVEHIINSDIKRHRSDESEHLWGFVDINQQDSWVGKMLSGGKTQEELAEEDTHWTKTCTHMVPAKGFTCGLWNLFHILTIGSSKTDHQLYGFHRGYFVSPHHVAEGIRNFVAYFFSCDVCRTNFLNMYDTCGHDHCNRLKSEITMGENDGSDRARKEVALWLWEVHNSVNARLMKEAAQRENRLVTYDETLASMFPTKRMCRGCWLDANMTKWDDEKVFQFLNDWYWPNEETKTIQSTPVIRRTKESIQTPVYTDISDTSRYDHATTISPGNLIPAFSSFGTGIKFSSLFCLLGFLLVAIAETRKRRDGRKKDV